MTSPGWRGALAILAVAFSLQLSAGEEVALFLDRCSGCHSIGEGDLAGPDLAASAGKPRADLRAAVERMQEHAGPLNAAEIDALTDLLLRPDAKALVHPPPAAAEPPVRKETGSAAAGRQLFFGEQRFASGAMPCFACHAVNGRGGTLARDLTGAGARLSETALIAAATKPAFPMMRSTYAKAAVTPKEALDIAAFLAVPVTTQTREPRAAAERPIAMHTAAGGVAALVLGGVALVFRARRAGVRSRMVKKLTTRR